MRFAVDAHAIGRRLTGNEVYVRSLLNAFATLDRESEFITYLSMDDAEAWVPSRFPVRRIAGNPFIRLGCDLALKLRRDRAELLHVQYPARPNDPDGLERGVAPPDVRQAASSTPPASGRERPLVRPPRPRCSQAFRSLGSHPVPWVCFR